MGNKKKNISKAEVITITGMAILALVLAIPLVVSAVYAILVGSAIAMTVCNVVSAIMIILELVGCVIAIKLDKGGNGYESRQGK